MPNTLEENVNRVKAAKTAIANAITAKGGTVGANDGLEDFASDIGTIPSGGGVEFSNTPNVFTLATNIQNLDAVLPNGITSINTSAFQDCTGLKSLIMPNSITNLGKQVFQLCTNLETVQMSNGMKYIRENSFFGCSKLKNIEIPDTVEMILSRAFMNCTALESIKFYKPTPISISATDVWTNIPTTCKIYVPSGSLSAYSSAANYPDPNTYTYVEY